VAIEFVRIDDRLLHGQVVTTWIRELNLEQCIVVNEAIAEDTLQRQLLELAAPEGMRVVFFAPEKFARVAAQNPIKRRTLLLFNNPFDVLQIIKLGVPVPGLNIGGMKNDGTKRQISKAVSVTPAEEQALRDIAAAGTRVVIQMVPRDSAASLEKALG
jgi:PTS system mannose-specific IIB component